MSLLLHGLFVFTVFQIANLQAIRPDTGGNGGDQLREVGIHVGEPEGGAGGTDDAPPAANLNAEDRRPSEVPLAESPNAEEIPSLSSAAPPVPLSLPDAGPRVIGSSPLGGRPASGFGEKMLRAPSGSGTSRSGRPGGGGADGVGFSRGSGGTSFIGIGARGRRFVYIIDRSGSMAEHGAFLAAKSEVLASLEQLDEKQQFQVIFYNTTPLTLRTREERIPMFTGTDANRLQVAEQLRAIEPDGGTQYLPALLKGFDFAPDVIYFLTDGIDPEVSPNQFLEKVRIRNSGGAHIHCIEFGDGPASKAGRTGNFLVKLAEANHGQYVYRDVTTLRRRQ